MPRTSSLLCTSCGLHISLHRREEDQLVCTAPLRRSARQMMRLHPADWVQRHDAQEAHIAARNAVVPHLTIQPS